MKSSKTFSKKILQHWAAAGLLIGIAVFAVSHNLTAQSQETYKTRLALVPADTKSRADITGLGTATAVLSGSKLTVNGSFEGLKSAATSAQLHNGIATGVRGPVICHVTCPRRM